MLFINLSLKAMLFLLRGRQPVAADCACWWAGGYATTCGSSLQICPRLGPVINRESGRSPGSDLVR
jgi:hypothetical protein